MTEKKPGDEELAALLAASERAAGKMARFAAIWREHPETFLAKLSLLVIDKVVIGAVLATCFYFYDSGKQADDQRFQAKLQADAHERQKEHSGFQAQLARQQAIEASDRLIQSAQIERDFEKARLLADVMSKITDESVNVVSRAYLLNAAAKTNSIDHGAVIDLAPVFVKQGLSKSDFIRVFSHSACRALDRVAARGIQLNEMWQAEIASVASPTATPEDSRRDDSQKRKDAIEDERRLWQELIWANADGDLADAIEGSDEKQSFVASGRGLCLILRPLDVEALEKTSRMSHQPFPLIHQIGISQDVSGTITLNSVGTPTNASEMECSAACEYIIEKLRGDPAIDTRFKATVIAAILQVAEGPIFRINAKFSTRLAEIIVHAAKTSDESLLRNVARAALLKMGTTAKAAELPLIAYSKPLREAAKRDESILSNNFVLGDVIEVLGALESDGADVELKAWVAMKVTNKYSSLEFHKCGAIKALERRTLPPWQK